MILVLDASAYLAMLLNEIDEKAQYALHARLRDAGFHVPHLWWYEVANGLMMGVKRGRHSLSLAKAVMTRSDEYLIINDQRPFPSKREKIVDLVALYGLTFYDASYLELAISRRATLVTQDKALLRAAGECDIEVVRF